MKKINHIALVVDRSDSTQGIAGEIVKQFNTQAEFINKQSKEAGQSTFLSLYTFSTTVDQPLLFEIPLDLVELRPLVRGVYHIQGMTALRDAVGKVVEDLTHFNETAVSKGYASGTEDHSFLVITLTDGGENESVKYSDSSLAQLMKVKVLTDLWSFVFSVPKGSKAELVRKFQLHEGNVQEWGAYTTADVVTASNSTIAGLGNYFKARTAGHKSTKSFFTTDLTKVSVSKVQKQLVECTTEFQKIAVPERSVIKDFCEDRVGSYVLGSAFYELMKAETIQPQKQIVVEQIQSGKLFGGDNARGLLKFPENCGNIRVHPGEHKNFRIFVQSTSVNRILLPNTSILVHVASTPQVFRTAASAKPKRSHKKKVAA